MPSANSSFPVSIIEKSSLLTTQRVSHQLLQRSHSTEHRELNTQIHTFTAKMIRTWIVDKSNLNYMRIVLKFLFELLDDSSAVCKMNK